MPLGKKRKIIILSKSYEICEIKNLNHWSHEVREIIGLRTRDQNDRAQEVTATR